MNWWQWLLCGLPWAVLASIGARARFGAYAWANLLWVISGPLSLPLLGLAIYARKR